VKFIFGQHQANHGQELMTLHYFRSTKRLLISTVILLVIVAAAYLVLVDRVQDEGFLIVYTDIAFPITNLLATIPLFWAAKRSKPYSSRIFQAWCILGLAQLSFTVADVIWGVLEAGLGQQAFPSIADGFYLLYYPLFLAGVLLLPSRRMERLDRYKSSLDILIVMVAASLGFWNFILGPIAAAGAGEPLLTQILSLAYPVGDLVLLTALVQLIYRQSEGKNPAPLFLLAAGAGVQIVTDAIYGRMALLDTYTSGGVLDLGWLISYVLIGMAGIWQAVTVPATATTQPTSLPAETPYKPNTWLTYFPYLCAAGAYLLLVFYHPHQSPMDYLLLTGGVGTVIGLVFMRQVLTLIENSQLFEQFRGAMDRVQGQTAELQQVNQELQLEIEERKRAEEQLAFDALHDPLTGLPNRVLFMDRIQQAMEFAKRRENYGFTIVFLDLDHFKLVNDSLGHSVGDQLLIATAQRLRLCMRSSDTVARLGGDEFVILLDDTQELPDVLSAAERIHHKLKDPYNLGEQKIYTTASFGIVASAKDYARPDEILRDADIAMYCAKAQGKARYEVFTPQLRDQAISRLEVKNDLQVALERGELFLNYQPIFDLHLSKMVGCEALIRWQHPARGLIKPSEFIPLAEEVGLINPIGQWVLREACHQMREWQEKFPRNPALTVSINVSADQINLPDFAGQIRQVLQETGLDGRSLKLEITEGIFLRKSERTVAMIRELNTLGVEFQIDDFGTGYSALSYLQDYPVQAVKIDRSFIGKIRANKASEIVRSIIAMAHELSMTTIAEGIEKDIELEYLKKYACDAGQGYLLHHPVDKMGIERLLREVSSKGNTQPVRLVADLDRSIIPELD